MAVVFLVFLELACHVRQSTNRIIPAGLWEIGTGFPLRKGAIALLVSGFLPRFVGLIFLHLGCLALDFLLSATFVRVRPWVKSHFEAPC